MDFKGKIIVITGGAEGIGYSIAEKLAELSAKVIIVDINDEKGKEAVENLKNGAEFIKYDLRHNSDTIFNEIIQKYNQIDILVNNAGVPESHGLEDVIKINLTASVSLGLKFYEYMKKNNRKGSILNISSIVGYRVEPNSFFYQATKSGIVAFTRSLGHIENFKKSGNKVIALCPGFTTTSFTKDYTDKESSIPENVKAFVNTQIFQDASSVGDAAVRTLKMAPSGSVWVIEGGKLEEVKIQVSTITVDGI